MSIANLIENVWVLSRHVGNNDIRNFYLTINALKYALSIQLFVYAFREQVAKLVDGTLNAKSVNIIEGSIKRHQYERKVFGLVHINLN